ncbi:DgyrCDS11022 [Dimorphilus gyrociliatus]|uniref:UBX domain-containing protein 4 n=2 Tax=Dimorphilus gyrociliatus TaxID=2664684 RepID=A0A7I8W4L0_9ANNE|nr:DgyrCDS11022 [Dimorphilus gyrociliatus]
MIQTWENEDVCKAIEETRSVCLKLEANSEECAQFSVYYPVMTVPTTYFIGFDGKQKLIVAGYVESADFLKKITEACDGVSPSDSASGVDLSINDKVEKAKEKLRQKQEERKFEESQKEKDDELNRRSTGKNVTKLKQWQETKEAEETRNQIIKDREEDKKAKERIKEQIARDRAERKARFEETQRLKKATTEKEKQEKLQREADEKRMEASRRSETARIQFRLPDGQAVNHFFPSGNKFQDAVDYLRTEHSLKNIQLMTNFPKRIYNPNEYGLSFSELQLAPSSVITVKLVCAVYFFIINKACVSIARKFYVNSWRWWWRNGFSFKYLQYYIKLYNLCLEHDLHICIWYTTTTSSSI